MGTPTGIRCFSLVRPHFAAGAFLLWRNGSNGSRGSNARDNRALSILADALLSAPFAWAVIYLLVENDPSERAERLLALWPVILVLALVFAVWEARRGLNSPGSCHLY